MRRAAAGLLAALALLATGCQARGSIDLRLDADGAGTLAVTLATDAELEARARGAGIDPLGDVAATGERLAASGWRVTEVTAGDGGRQVTLAVEFAGPSELEEVAADLAGALAAPELEPIRDLRVEVGDDEIVVEATAGLVPTAAVDDLGLAADEAVALLAARDAVDYTVTVSLPGEVLETTAVDPAATPLRWEIEPGEEVRILARGRRPASPVEAIALGGAVAGVLVLLAAGVAARRRRRRRRFTTPWPRARP